MLDDTPALLATLVVTADAEGLGVGDGVSAAGRSPPVTAAPLLEAVAEAVAVLFGATETVELADGAGLAEPDADGEAVGIGWGLP